MVIESTGGVVGIGCAGGLLAELLHWWGLRRDSQLPAYLKIAFYWAVTALMIAAGGFVTWLYFGARAEGLLALHVGVSTPLIVQKLFTSMPPSQGATTTGTKPRPGLRGFFTW